LHGHEQFCPACGTKQYVRPEYRSFLSQSERPFNPLPFALATVLLAFVLIIAAQNSWIGQVMRRQPEVVDPMSTLTPQAARQMLEEKLVANLTSVGAKGSKLTWTCGEKQVDRNCPQTVDLAIDTQLSDAQQRRLVVDPVKQLMDPGKISSITMNDSRSHATWTYSLAPSLIEDKADVPNIEGQSPNN
jgi:hypothetical protein